jgi:hydroxylamine reductase (hybrid-cluster protein)
LTLKLKPTLEGLVKQGGEYGLMSDPDVDPDIRSLKHTLLFGIKGMAAYTDHAAEFGQEDEANYEFVHRVLAALEDKTLGMNELPGHAEDKPDMEVLVGFGHQTVLGVADKIVAGVKDGSIGHFFLMGGCDGVKKSRNYYTEFVEKTPEQDLKQILG